MERIGYWYGWGHGSCLYDVSVDNGVLKVGYEFDRNKVYSHGHSDQLKFKREIGARYFGDPEYLIGVYEEWVTEFLVKYNGKNKEEAMAFCDAFRTVRDERRAKREAERKRWAETREKFDGFVIGIDSKIDIYESGFSVRVLFGSDVSFFGKKKFLAENKVEFLRWVIHELSESKNAMKKVGDMRFYRPVEIVNLRAQEVEVKFEIKKEVA